MAAKVANPRIRKTVLQLCWKNGGSYEYAKRMRQRTGLQIVRVKAMKNVVDEDVGGKRWGGFSTASTAAFGARIEAG